MRLKRSLASKIISVFRGLNIDISRGIEKPLLDKFFAKMNPIATQFELIRVGGDGDGGYLIPNDLDGVEICFSPGVSDVASFELDLGSKGIISYLADFSVNHPPVDSDFFVFDKKFLGSDNDEIFTTLARWICKKGVKNNDLILQMDIEGAEYDVIFETSLSIFKRFRIMIIEFHQFDKIINPAMYKLISNSFNKILSEFEIVHIHPNNCATPINIHGYQLPPVLEFTFLRKDRIKSMAAATDFPHNLDRKNVQSNKDFALPRCWYER